MNYLFKEVGGSWMRGALANCQAAGFNKPQRSGLIRTCPDRSTGSKPLEDLTLGGVSVAILESILKRVLAGILKRISHSSAIESRATVFHVIFTRPSYGDQRKAAQAAKSVSKCPGIVPERAHTVTRSLPRPLAARG